MEPILLVHGYSAESAKGESADVRAIFGSLPDDLRKLLFVPGAAGAAVPEVIDINVSRYVSLDDGVDLDDVTLAFDRVIRRDFPHLLNGFNASGADGRISGRRSLPHGCVTSGRAGRSGASQSSKGWNSDRTGRFNTCRRDSAGGDLFRSHRFLCARRRSQRFQPPCRACQRS